MRRRFFEGKKFPKEKIQDCTEAVIRDFVSQGGVGIFEYILEKKEQIRTGAFAVKTPESDGNEVKVLIVKIADRYFVGREEAISAARRETVTGWEITQIKNNK